MMSAKYMALALAVLLPGCTMAPNYVRPEAPVAEAWPDDLMPKGTVLAQATDQLASEIGWNCGNPQKQSNLSFRIGSIVIITTIALPAF